MACSGTCHCRPPAPPTRTIRQRLLTPLASVGLALGRLALYLRGG